MNITNEPEFLLMFRPVVCTSMGRRPRAVEARFWMSTAARSRFRSRSNVAVTELEPSLLLVELE